MSMVELRDLDAARVFVIQGIWLRRLAAPVPDTTGALLAWAAAAAAGEHGLPPVGFLGDLGNILLTVAGAAPVAGAMPGFPPVLARAYEDHVLSKLAGDFSLERAGDALRRYPVPDQAQGVAYVAAQFHQRAGFRTVSLSPAVIKALQHEPPDRVLKEGWDSLQRDGLSPELSACYESLIRAARETAEILGPEDLFELEHGTALAEFGQRVALRQVLQAAENLTRTLPPYRPRSTVSQRDIATRVLDEDTYPVGGFSSLSTRGTIESLLQSQLALMEKADRPDLFDVKYVRDELLYYSRDDNNFLRRRRTLILVLQPDLTQARFKDVNLPWQRIILLLALVLVIVRQLCEWLREEALRFEILFLDRPTAREKAFPALADEWDLCRTLFREQIANGTVVLDAVPTLEALARRSAAQGRRSLCHCLLAGMSPHKLTADDTEVAQLGLAGPRPELTLNGEQWIADTGDLWDAWPATLARLLHAWV